MTRKFERSRVLFEQLKRSMAGGISSSVRGTELPLPLFYEKGCGSKIFDVDGNEYIDYVLGMGPLILGHNPQPVINAVKDQLDRGLLYAAQNELEVKVSEKIIKYVPSAELVRFNNTGSEAVQVAIRLARAYTGKKKIIKFEGQYHGWIDNVLVSTHPDSKNAGPGTSPIIVLETLGQSDSALDEIIVLPWNDLEIAEQVVREKNNEIAAIITEPIISNFCILPGEGYLEGLRALCDRNNIVLIFDEVVTGFRYALGGAQTYLGVTPDITTFAKGIAAGLPLSCVCGKREIMDLITTGEVVHSGTYNSNPVVMAAAFATISELEKDDSAAIKQMYTISLQLSSGIKKIVDRYGVPCLIQNTGPTFYLAFTPRKKYIEYRDIWNEDKEKYKELRLRLMNKGVRIKPIGQWFVSSAHTDDDVQITLEAVDQSMKEIFN